MSTIRSSAILRRDAAMVIFVAAIFILAVVYSVLSATTISSSAISTDGTLAVTGISTLTGAVYASSTLQATGDGLFYDQLSAGASTNTPTTTFNVTGSGYLTGGLGVGFATTGSGGFHATGFGVIQGRLGLNGTTSPYQELGVEGDAALNSQATTTMSLESTSATQGGCIELEQASPVEEAGGQLPANRWIRIYPGRGSLVTASSTNSSIGLVIERGRCQ